MSLTCVPPPESMTFFFVIFAVFFPAEITGVFAGGFGKNGVQNVVFRW
jgi:hypothetical protein